MDWNDNDVYCRDLVRRVAHDAYVVSLFAPVERRSALWAIHAFNYEIAKIRETVSEPMLGEIRLQWWSDAIEEIFTGTPRQHQVVQALANAKETWGLERKEFQTLIMGRMNDLKNGSFANVEELCGYIDKTVTPLNRLALKVLEVPEDEKNALAVSAASVSYGMAGLLRAAPYFFKQNRNFLPIDLMNEAGLSERALLSLRPSSELSKIIARLGEMAFLRLDEVAGIKLSRSAYPAVLSAAQARWYLMRLKRVNYDPYVYAVTLPIPFHEARLALKVWSRKWQ